MPAADGSAPTPSQRRILVVCPRRSDLPRVVASACEGVAETARSPRSAEQVIGVALEPGALELHAALALLGLAPGTPILAVTRAPKEHRVVPCVSLDHAATARRRIRRFAHAAWRRPVMDDLLAGVSKERRLSRNQTRCVRHLLFGGVPGELHAVVGTSPSMGRKYSERIRRRLGIDMLAAVHAPLCRQAEDMLGVDHDSAVDCLLARAELGAHERAAVRWFLAGVPRKRLAEHVPLSERRMTTAASRVITAFDVVGFAGLWELLLAEILAMHDAGSG